MGVSSMRMTSIVCAAALMCGAAPALAEQFSIGTLPQGSSGYVIAAAIASTASDHTDNDFIAV